jgi:murein DD-endopeptidase MepM/ murein hydrolase activator NlpD
MMMPFSVTPGRWLTVPLVAVLSAIATPAHALAVRVLPQTPQLGSTITVFADVEDGQAPVVSLNGTSYPAFAIAAQTYRALIPTSPLDPPGPLMIQVQGDGETLTRSVTLRDRHFRTQRITVRGGGSNATQYELDRVAAFKRIVTPEKFWRGAFVRPSQGRVSSEYGIRRYYNGVFAQDYYHRGVDYAAGSGSPVVAPAAGVVRLVDREANGFRVHGNTVGIDHGQGVLSILLHLNRIDVREGQTIQAGQRIGTVGSTGSSTGPHLHWGLYVNGIAVDPVPWRFEGLE